MIGPAIINVVRCHRCGTSYNGVHGDYNGSRIAIYIVVSIVLGLLIAGLVIALNVAEQLTAGRRQSAHRDIPSTFSFPLRAWERGTKMRRND